MTDHDRRWADGSKASSEAIIEAGRRNGTGRPIILARLYAGESPEQAIRPPDPRIPDSSRPLRYDLLRLSWDQRFMQLARFWSQNSKDPSTKVGAVIVGRDKREDCMGYNGFPPGIADDDRLKERETKYPLMIHAERNALDNARFDTRGATLYATLAPCCGCASSIISKGIKIVVCPKPDIESDIARRHGIKAALEALEEGGVLVEWEEPA